MKKNAVHTEDYDDLPRGKINYGKRHRSSTIKTVTGHREVKNLKHAWLEHANDYEGVEEFYSK